MKRLSPTLFCSAVALVFLFQLLTLNAPGMNGDEAIFMLIVEEVRKILQGGASLNPLIDYSGPLDFWLMGSVYGITSFAPWIPVGAWMVRIVPFLTFWTGLWILYREIKLVSEEKAHWCLFIGAIAPMSLIYSRVAFQHSFLLGVFSILLAESLRIARTGEFRWLRTALLVGFAAEAHTTAFVVFPVIFLPVVVPLLKWARKEPLRALLAVIVSGVMASSVLRNFPPPTSVPAEIGRDPIREIRNLLNMVSGQQPIYFRFHTSLPDILGVVFLIFLFAALGALCCAMFRNLKSGDRNQPGSQSENDQRYDRMIFRVTLAHILGSAFMAWSCWRGRSMAWIGHERYFMALVPGWMLIWSDAFRRLEFNRWVAVALFALFFGSVAIPTAHEAWSEEDPTHLAARWLEKECPRETCLAYAQNFWNYWPIRYYTRDSIDVNFVEPFWRTVKIHSSEGRTLAGCWQFDSKWDDTLEERMYKGPFTSRVIFPMQAANPGEICFKGIKQP